MVKREQENPKRGFKERIAVFLATGFYSGYFPLAPGTIGTIVAIPMYLLISRFNSIIYYSIITIVLFIIGIFVSSIAIKKFRREDPSPVVLDEIVGFLVAMFFIELTLWRLVVAFFLFRLFDIIKPFPVGAVENVGKGFGVMADDLIAGIYTNLILQIAIRLI